MRLPAARSTKSTSFFPGHWQGPPTAASVAALACLCLLAAGCQRSVDAHYVLSEQVEALDDELQAEVEAVLREHCGTPQAPKLLGSERDDDAFQRHLQRGAAIYTRYCAQCHGTTGDGNGVAAQFLNPRPRDYRRGIFKFTSTPYGAKPRPADLMRTIRRGITGTSMPAFKLLPEEDLEAVVDYVLALTHRGELEVLLAAEAELEEEIDPEIVPDYIEAVLSQWELARDEVVLPETLMPRISEETIAEGRHAFMTKGCSKCHGEDGRGATRENVGVDAWGFQTKAADLTSGMLRGGQEPLDIYRRISSGINGTPMPSFKQSLAEEPDTIWHLVHYVLHVANRRREGELPPLQQQAAVTGSETGDADGDPPIEPREETDEANDDG